MQCTPDQIEEKRRQALAKLAQKRKLENGTTNNVNHKQLCFQSPIKSVPQNAFPTTPLHTNSRISHPFNNSSSTIAQSFNTSTQVAVTCSLISDHRVQAEISLYNAQVIDIFKTITSRSYDPKSKVWSFHMKDYDFLINKLCALQPTIVVNKLPKFVTQCLRILESPQPKIDLTKIEPELFNTLMPFQRDGVCFGISKRGRCYIADDMGLGKTFQALAIADYYREDWPLLIVTTASMKNVWETTIQKYLPSINLLHIQYMVSSKDYINDAKVLIVSHDMMSRSGKLLLDRRFGVIIIDESHIFKNFKAKCTGVAKDLAKAAKRIILLSGTPALSRPSELFSQLSFIDEKFFGNFFEYSKRYCNAAKTNFGWDASGKSNLQELEVILAKKFMIRRTKEDVLKSLPEKQREVVALDIKLQQLSEVDKKCLSALATSYQEKKAQEKHAALLSFFSETARIKIPSVCTYILELLEADEKFLVFAHHKIMLDAIAELLHKKKVSFIRIDGTTNSDQRRYFVDKFQLQQQCKCALLSITAANAGITLTSAKIVVFAELHWNPSILSQAESRAHRIGQQNQVQIKYLLAGGTADDSIWPLLKSKQNILSEIGLNRDSFEDASLTKQNITNIDSSIKTNVTASCTKDISSYFEKKDNSNADIADIESYFDDDFDDCLENIDLDSIV